MLPKTKFYKDKVTELGFNKNDFHIRTDRFPEWYKDLSKEGVVHCKLSAKEIYKNVLGLFDADFAIIFRINSNGVAKEVELAIGYNGGHLRIVNRGRKKFVNTRDKIEKALEDIKVTDKTKVKPKNEDS